MRPRPAGSRTPRCRACAATWRSSSSRRTGARPWCASTSRTACIYSLFYTHLDDAAIDQGAGSYSLVAQHLSSWFKDQRKWVDALYKAWVADPETGAANKALLAATTAEALEAALTAMVPVAARADELVGAGSTAALDTAATSVRDAVAALTA